jgi:hypothetical protein
MLMSSMDGIPPKGLKQQLALWDKLKPSAAPAIMCSSLTGVRDLYFYLSFFFLVFSLLFFAADRVENLLVSARLNELFLEPLLFFFPTAFFLLAAFLAAAFFVDFRRTLPGTSLRVCRSFPGDADSFTSSWETFISPVSAFDISSGCSGDNFFRRAPIQKYISCRACGVSYRFCHVSSGRSREG